MPLFEVELVVWVDAPSEFAAADRAVAGEGCCWIEATKVTPLVDVPVTSEKPGLNAYRWPEGTSYAVENVGRVSMRLKRRPIVPAYPMLRIWPAPMWRSSVRFH